MMVVGICGGKYGKGKTGKTTAAKMLEEKLGFFYMSLMAPVVSAYEANPDDHGHDRLADLDLICSKGRAISEDYWLGIALKGIPEGCERVVLDDLWFGNEAKFIEDQSGMILLVIKPGEEDDPHREFFPNETIDNNSTVEDLGAQVVSAVGYWFGV